MVVILQKTSSLQFIEWNVLSVTSVLKGPFDNKSPLTQITVKRLTSKKSLPEAKVTPLQWRHNGHDGVSNHQPRGCLLSRLIRCRSKKPPKLRVTGLCVENSPGTGQFLAQMASKAENVSIWWCHHAVQWWIYECPGLNKYMMMSSNGNIFRVTGLLCGVFIGDRWIPQSPATGSFDVFFDLRMNCINSSLPEQNGHQFANDIFKCIFVKEKFVFWLKFHWSYFQRVQLTITQLWSR